MRTADFGRPGVFFLAIGLMAGTLGCGSGDGNSETAANPSQASNPPTASVPIAETAPAENLPQKETPEWYLHEITLERLKPTPETDDINKIRDSQRARNYKIVELANHAVAKTHDDPAKQQLFETAVHHAMEAQMQLAIQVNGVNPAEHQQNVEELFQNAQLLYKKAPESKAANEAAFTLVKFAEIMARKLADEDPSVLEEYARVARMFALTFPKDEARAIAKLDAAGWSCEAYGKLDLAIDCYAQIESQFPKNPLAQHVPALLRRLRLKGQELQLAGPTHDGKFLNIDTLRNKVVLVAFWAADTDGFELDAAILKDVYAKYASQGFEIVGVNLDEERSPDARFYESAQLHLAEHLLSRPNQTPLEQPAGAVLRHPRNPHVLAGGQARHGAGYSSFARKRRSPNPTTPRQIRKHRENYIPARSASEI